MTNEVKKIIEAEGLYRLCRCGFQFNDIDFYYFISEANDKFFLGAVEEDFLLDGFDIRICRDVAEVEYIEDVGTEILRKKQVLKDMKIPAVDLTSFYTIFASLYLMNKIVSVENEWDDGFCYMGKIRKIKRDSVLFLPVDCNGMWLEEVEIFFDEITLISFDIRYTSTWEEYLKERSLRAKGNPRAFIAEIVNRADPAGFFERGFPSGSYESEIESVRSLLEANEDYYAFASSVAALFAKNYVSFELAACEDIAKTLWVELKEK